MNYKRTVSIILGVALMLTSLASATPVLDVRYDISDEEFEAMTFTNPDSVNAFEEASMADDFDLFYEAPKKAISSPNGKYRVSEGQDENGLVKTYLYKGDEQMYRIRNLVTGPYPVAFSPDGEMYASYDTMYDSTIGVDMYEVAIYSSETGKLLVKEVTTYQRVGRMFGFDNVPYDASSMFSLYWTENSGIVFDVICGYSSDPSSAVGDVLVMKHNILNVDYNELQSLNGGSVSPVVTQEEPQQVDVNDNEDTSILSTDTEESPTSSDTTPSTPAFTFSFALTAFVAGRKISKRK